MELRYTYFAVSAYILMRAVEVAFADRKDRAWYPWMMRVIAVAVFYSGAAAVLSFYFDNVNWLGLDGGACSFWPMDGTEGGP